jgi:hypothetical protein
VTSCTPDSDRTLRGGTRLEVMEQGFGTLQANQQLQQRYEDEVDEGEGHRAMLPESTQDRRPRQIRVLAPFAQTWASRSPCLLDGRAPTATGPAPLFSRGPVAAGRLAGLPSTSLRVGGSRPTGLSMGAYARSSTSGRAAAPARASAGHGECVSAGRPSGPRAHGTSAAPGKRTISYPSPLHPPLRFSVRRPATPRSHLPVPSTAIRPLHHPAAYPVARLRCTTLWAACGAPMWCAALTKMRHMVHSSQA